MRLSPKGLGLAARLARRELRGGIEGFRIFLLCLALGVGAIAAVASVRSAIEQGLAAQGAVLLGGDAELEFTYRLADDAERSWIAAQALATSEIVDFRSMAVVGQGDGAERALTQVKGVDDAYPLTGAVVLDPAMPLALALAGSDGVPGGVMDRVLADRLGLQPGDLFRLGLQEFRLMALLLREPDAAAGGFSLGPRTIVATTALAGSDLLQPGTLFETAIRMLLPAGADLAALETRAETAFRDKGVRWHDRRNGAPGVARFIDRIGSFLVLVGLAGLATGGVGISAAVRAYLAGKVATIATIKVLGGEARLIFQLYLLQIGALTLLGLAAGLLLGAIAPLILGPVIAAQMPVPVEIGLYPRALAEAALYGSLTAAIFTLWPLAATENIRAATLYRAAGFGRVQVPRWPYLLATLLLVAVLVGASALLSGVVWLALSTAGGVMAALAVLVLAALALRWLAKRGAQVQVLRRFTALRLALGAIGGPGNEALPVVLSLGLGLAVLAAVGQIDVNLRHAIDTELPDRAPTYFFVDIQPDQIAGYAARLAGDPGVSRVESAPMLRGVITRIRGLPARDVAGDHWVVSGDRGVTFSDAVPPNVTLTAGEWWPKDYQGPAQISFAAEEAAEIGLQLGDSLSVNILGREIEATVTSFRQVDFSNAGIGFILSINPSALQGAPHSYISTVYADPAAEAPILRDLASAYPNITAIRVRDAVTRVADALASIAAATRVAAAATLLTGFVVLLGAAAAGVEARVQEAAVLKVLGATRGRILLSFALRSALMGAAAGVVAVLAGGLSGWGVMHFVMEGDYRFEPWSALMIVAGGIGATLLAGLAFAWRPLALRPGRVLRAAE